MTVTHGRIRYKTYGCRCAVCTTDIAAYMREYRARRKAVHQDYDAAKPTIGRIKTEASARIRELEEEVRHLKAELAKRPEPWVIGPGEPPSPDLDVVDRFNTRPFTPVPKHR